MSKLFFRNHGDSSDREVNGGNPLPVEVLNAPSSPAIAVGRLWSSEWMQPAYGATSGALDANDAFGDPFLIEGVPARGRILSIKMIDQDDDTLAAIIHVYSQPFTAAASDAAYTIGANDGLNWVTTETFDAGYDEGSFKGFVIKDVNVDYVAPNGKLYAQLSTTGTPNIANQGTMPRLKFYILPMA